jgi:hypothetical protein
MTWEVVLKAPDGSTTSRSATGRETEKLFAELD